MVDGGHAWQGACMPEGAYMPEGMHDNGMHAGETVTEVGGVHPTGMHSCLHLSTSDKIKTRTTVYYGYIIGRNLIERGHSSLKI